MEILSPGEALFVRQRIMSGMRCDGRELLELRPVSVEIDVLKNCLASSRIRIGSRGEGTEVLVGLKGETYRVPKKKDEERTLQTIYPPVEVSVNFLPGVEAAILTPSMRVQTLDSRYTELSGIENNTLPFGSSQQSIDGVVSDVSISADTAPGISSTSSTQDVETMLQSHFNAIFNSDRVNRSEDKKGPLAIDEMDCEWKLFADVVVVEYAGSLIEATSMGIYASLSTLRLPVPVINPEEKNNTEEEEGESFILSPFARVDHIPISVSCFVMNSDKGTHSDPLIYIDADTKEEACASAKLLYSTAQNGEIYYAEKVHGDGCVSLKTFSVARRVSREKAQILASKINQALHQRTGEGSTH